MTLSRQPNAVDTDKLAEALRDVIGRVVRTVRDHTGTQTSAQSETLTHLERSGPLSIAALAEARGVKHQTMRLVVSKLALQGLLDTRADSTDGRSYEVILTQKGKAELGLNRIARAKWLASQLASKLDADELMTLEKAVSLLERIT